VLFVYVTTHLANHALGLVSLETAESGRLGFIAFWRSLPATLALYGALTVHIALAFIALYERYTLRMPAAELLRIVLGFAIPFLLIRHLIGTRIAYELYGQADPYARVAWVLWSLDSGVRQLALTTAAWLHGCLGMHFLLRYRSFYRRRLYLFLAPAALLPVLAYLGFVAMAKEIALRGPAALLPPMVIDASQWRTLDLATELAALVFASCILALFAARGLRAWRARLRNALLKIEYPGRTVTVPRGFSVLEASRANGIPHLSLCGGRARCSTCRIAVAASESHVPPASAEERRTLERIHAPANVRLACQLRPSGDIRVTPLLPAAAHLPQDEHALEFGTEREVVILFVDLRRWTGLAEEQLPYDLVYLLNQYFAAVGDAVHEAGGVPNQFIGDSVMAIFGLNTDLASASAQALAAAAGIERRMSELNHALDRNFARELKSGIGIHAGRAVVGSVGYRDTRTLSAVGDTVNTASRLQELTKAHGVSLVISEQVALAAQLEVSGLQAHELAIRGRSAPLKIFAIDSAAGLAGRFAGSGA
jgi:adenylate cyclase